MAGAGRHDGDVEPRHQEHEGNVLVEDRVEELPSDQSVGEDEAGHTERTEQQTQLTELDHLQTRLRLDNYSLSHSLLYSSSLSLHSSPLNQPLMSSVFGQLTSLTTSTSSS